MTPVQRRRHIQRVECRFVAAFVGLIVMCFGLLKRQRRALPHDMRISGVHELNDRRHAFHILHIVVDDLGWAEAERWRRSMHSQEVLGLRNGLAGGDPMPFLTALREEGVSLNQFYAPKDCAPSRVSTS